MTCLRRRYAVIWLLGLTAVLAACTTAQPPEPAPTETAVLPTNVPTLAPTITRVPTAAETAVATPAPMMPVETKPRSLTYHEMTLSDGTVLTYALVLPPDFDPAKSYPVLLALPPGAQTRSMVDAGLDLYWRDGAYQYGWIVVSPAAPNSTLFFRGSETLLPEFLDQIMAMYPPEGGQFHLAGISNGGLGAFRVAIDDPNHFASLIGVPGFPPTDEDFGKLERLVNIPVALHVGETDTSWRAQMERTEAALAELGGTVSLTVAAGEGHVIQSLVGGDELFAFLEAARVK